MGEEIRSPEKMAETNKSRLLSDAEAVKSGAEFGIKDTEGNVVKDTEDKILFTEGQKQNAKEKMERGGRRKVIVETKFVIKRDYADRPIETKDVVSGTIGGVKIFVVRIYKHSRDQYRVNIDGQDAVEYSSPIGDKISHKSTAASLFKKLETLVGVKTINMAQPYIKGVTSTSELISDILDVDTE